jgi:hypothetical protein
MPRPRIFDRGEPYAEVRPHGRHQWYITLHHGVMETSGRFSWGSRERADRKARRMLDKYMRESSQQADVHRVTAGSVPTDRLAEEATDA